MYYSFLHRIPPCGTNLKPINTKHHFCERVRCRQGILDGRTCTLRSVPTSLLSWEICASHILRADFSGVYCSKRQL